MASILDSSNQGSLGIEPRSLIVRCRNAEASTALARGDLVRLDFSQSSIITGQGDAALTSASNSKFANVVLSSVTASSSESSIYGVAQEAISAGATGNIMFAGITTVKSVATGTYAAGERVGLGTTTTTTKGLVHRLTVTQPVGTVLVGGATPSTITILLQGELAYGPTGT